MIGPSGLPPLPVFARLLAGGIALHNRNKGTAETTAGARVSARGGHGARASMHRSPKEGRPRLVPRRVKLRVTVATFSARDPILEEL